MHMLNFLLCVVPCATALVIQTHMGIAYAGPFIPLLSHNQITGLGRRAWRSRKYKASLGYIMHLKLT